MTSKIFLNFRCLFCIIFLLGSDNVDVTKETTQYLRPMMKISEMVPYLKEKNIKFEKMSEKDAEKYGLDKDYCILGINKL